LAIAAYTGQSRHFACGQSVVPPRKIAAPWRNPRHLNDNAFEHTQSQRFGHTARLPKQTAFGCKGNGLPRLFGRPIQRGIGLREVFGTGRESGCVDPVGIIKAVTDTYPLETRITVRWIIYCSYVCRSDKFGKLRPPPAEQWPKQWRVVPRNARYRSHACKTTQTRPAIQTHHQRLSLIISMVRRNQRGHALLIQPLPQRGVARGACPFLNGRARRQRKR
jgi:hypothetical protein